MASAEEHTQSDREAGKEGISYNVLFPHKWQIPWRPHPGPDPEAFIQSAVGKTLMGGAVGYGLGLAIGVLLGSFESTTPPIPLAGQRELPDMPIREQLRESWRLTGQKARGWGQNFMVITMIFSGAENVIERARGEHDIWNGTLAGCAAGAGLAVKSGPAAMCFGCAGFAAFSAAIEYYTGGH